MKLYDTLDIKRSATQQEIKDAYRDKARDLHPDKGGDKKKFAETARAYEILSDVKSRKRYDRTGIEQDLSSSLKMANGLLQKLFTDIIEKVGAEKILKTDVVGVMKNSLNEGIDKLKGDEKKFVLKKNVLLKVMKRISHKNCHNNLAVVVRSQIDMETRNLQNVAINMEIAQIAIKMLKDYGFKFDKVQESQAGIIYEFTTTASTGGW